jgi:mannose-6-phosphate isomerase-like protein (cupin superfamily)
MQPISPGRRAIMLAPLWLAFLAACQPVQSNASGTPASESQLETNKEIAGRNMTNAMQTLTQAVIVQPGTVEELHAFGDVLSVLLGGEQTGGSLTVMSDVTPPGGGPPLHVHSREDEFFLVVEGQISYFVDDQWTEVGPGGSVYFPRGSAHRYRNVGTTDSKHWILTTPSGFEHFFAECAQEFAKAGGPDMQRIVEIHHKYGIELLEEGEG